MTPHANESELLFEAAIDRYIIAGNEDYQTPARLRAKQEADALLARALSCLSRKLDALNAAVRALQLQERTMDQKLQATIDSLTEKVAANTTVDQSVLTLVTGLKGQLDAAIQSAKDAGASDAQLSALTDLGATIDSNSASLRDAVTANTPSA